MRSLSTLLLATLVACTGTDKAADTAGTDEGPVNLAPIAAANDDLTQSADSRVALNGAASSDPNGDAITFEWSFEYTPDGSALTTRELPFAPNESAEAVRTEFMPDVLGTYVVKLVVRDAKGLASAPDYVIVQVTEPENIPVANAGADITTQVAQNVTLDGSASNDPLGRTLTYNWLLVDKPATSSVTLSGADTAAPTLTPDAKGVYVVNLIVNNGLVSSTADAVSITVTADDSAPVANAGEDQTVEDCTSINLDCSGSTDPDGDALTYSWEVQSKPAGSTATAAAFSDRTAQRPTFWADVAGTYVLSCAVSDGSNWATPDRVTLVASERAFNTRPAAYAGAAVVVDGGSATCVEDGYVYDCEDCAGQTLTLGTDASATDADGDPITHTWTVTSGSGATISSPGELVSSVSLPKTTPEEPGECTETDFRFQLEVTDCTGASSTSTVDYTVTCCGI